MLRSNFLLRMVKTQNPGIKNSYNLVQPGHEEIQYYPLSSKIYISQNMKSRGANGALSVLQAPTSYCQANPKSQKDKYQRRTKFQTTNINQAPKHKIPGTFLLARNTSASPFRITPAYKFVQLVLEILFGICHLVLIIYFVSKRNKSTSAAI